MREDQSVRDSVVLVNDDYICESGALALLDHLLDRCVSPPPRLRVGYDPVEGSFVKLGGFGLGLASYCAKFGPNSIANVVKFDEIQLKFDYKSAKID